MSLIKFIDVLFELYVYVIIARALMSWFNPNPYNRIVRFINDITDPPLRFIQRIVPTFGGLDISPVILIVIVFFARRIVISILLALAGY